MLEKLMPETAERTTEEQSHAFDEVWSSPKGRLGLVRTINNIPIAQRYITTAFTLFLAGGVLALLMRTQLAVPENDFVDAETYNQLFTMHGTTMMFLFVIPFVEALANYMLPLVLGTRDLPFPRLTALSYWTYLFGALFIYASFLFGVAPDGGWFAYPPLTLKEFSPGINVDFWDIGLSVAEVAAMGAAAELIVAILRMRAPGMSLNRLPIFAWAMLITAFMIVFAFTPLIVGTAMLEFDRKGMTRFFDPTAGGAPLLWQHLFWTFGHPEVYIMFIPATGIVSQVVQVFARRPIVSYPLVVLSLLATGFISFGLWVHHMFATGLSSVAMGFFAAASLVIAIPNGIQFVSWIATLWIGKPVWKTPLLFVLGFLFIFLLGGFSGVMVGAIPFDWQAHDSYFVVAHFHYVLIGGVVFPFFAALYYWLPKITGRMLNERMGRWNFWVMFVFFNVAFFPMHLSGLLGMPRRVYTYPAGLGWEAYNLISTVGAFGFAAGVLIFVANVFWSLKYGQAAGADPWSGDTLEWSHSSPPPNAQFKYIPYVTSRHPMWDQATLEPEREPDRSLLQPMQSAPTRWRGAVVVSVMDARPLAVAKLPGPTVWPFVMSVGFVFLFAGAMLETLWILLVGAAITAVSLVGWFRPRETEAIAMREVGVEPEPGRLPLAVYGPMSNGYWGTVVFLLIWLTALASLVASFFYLGPGPSVYWPAAGTPGLLRPALATLVMAAAAATTWVFARSVRRGEVRARRAALPATLLLHALFAWLTVRAFLESGIRPSETAYGSAFVFLLAFEWLTLVVVAVLLLAAQLWAWTRPDDPRGWATTLNDSLISYFAAGSWAVVFVVLYLSQRVL
jgi:cytochrome c oxidase subunit I+III